MAAGLRNWRGEVIGANDANEDAATTTATSSPSPAIPLPRAAENGETSRDAVSGANEERHQDGASTSTESKERAVVFRKDEFGRDIPVEVSASDKDKSRKKSGKKKYSKKKSKKKLKHKRSSRSRSRSPSVPRSIWMKRAINAVGRARDIAAVEAEASVDQDDTRTDATGAHAVNTTTAGTKAAPVEAEVESETETSGDVEEVERGATRVEAAAEVGAAHEHRQHATASHHPQVSGRTMRLKTGVQVPCARRIRFTVRNLKRGCPELEVYTCPRNSSEVGPWLMVISRRKMVQSKLNIQLQQCINTHEMAGMRKELKHFRWNIDTTLGRSAL
ncbi:hypothetical protein FI667_g199, partial [Globisporangium splendens]